MSSCCLKERTYGDTASARVNNDIVKSSPSLMYCSSRIERRRIAHAPRHQAAHALTAQAHWLRSAFIKLHVFGCLELVCMDRSQRTTVCSTRGDQTTTFPGSKTWKLCICMEALILHVLVTIPEQIQCVCEHPNTLHCLFQRRSNSIVHIRHCIIAFACFD